MHPKSLVALLGAEAMGKDLDKLISCNAAPRYLILDRDGKYGDVVPKTWL